MLKIWSEQSAVGAEGDIYGYAEKALQKGTPTIINYDLSDNEIWGLGIGCKGSLEILVLPAKREDPFWIRLLTNCYTTKRNFPLL